MRQAIMTLAGLCLMAALCEQLLGGGQMLVAVRRSEGLCAGKLSVGDSALGRCGVRQAIMTLAGLCLMAALCEQLLGGGRLFGAVRLLLGLEIIQTVLGLAEELARMLG